MPASATKEENEVKDSVNRMLFPTEQTLKEKQHGQQSQRVVSKRQRVNEYGDLSPKRLFEKESEGNDKHANTLKSNIIEPSCLTDTHT